MAKNDTPRRNPNYARLLNRICVGLGYCGSIVDGKPRQVDDFIPAEGPVAAREFAAWVILAEGLDPPTDPHERAIRNAFVEHMGANVVNATQLK
jgi:hypothetical protein